MYAKPSRAMGVCAAVIVLLAPAAFETEDSVYGSEIDAPATVAPVGPTSLLPRLIDTSALEEALHAAERGVPEEALQRYWRVLQDPAYEPYVLSVMDEARNALQQLPVATLDAFAFPPDDAAGVTTVAAWLLRLAHLSERARRAEQRGDLQAETDLRRSILSAAQTLATAEPLNPLQVEVVAALTDALDGLKRIGLQDEAAKAEQSIAVLAGHSAPTMVGWSLACHEQAGAPSFSYMTTPEGQIALCRRLWLETLYRLETDDAVGADSSLAKLREGYVATSRSQPESPELIRIMEWYVDAALLCGRERLDVALEDLRPLCSGETRTVAGWAARGWWGVIQGDTAQFGVMLDWAKEPFFEHARESASAEARGLLDLVLGHAYLGSLQCPNALDQYTQAGSVQPDTIGRSAVQAFSIAVAEAARCYSDVPAMENAYGKFLDAFPDHRFTDDALLCLANLEAATGRPQTAHALYADIVDRFPSGYAADEARQRLGNPSASTSP